MLVQGGESVYVLPEDVEKFKQTLPGVRHEVVAGAGHAVQSDQPKALAELIKEFVK
jgi:pimeloyl-ACP methyl ester carboxylesterase